MTLGPYVQIILLSPLHSKSYITSLIGLAVFFFFLNEVYDDSLRNPKTQVPKSQTVRASGYYMMDNYLVKY